MLPAFIVPSAQKVRFTMKYLGGAKVSRLSDAP